MVDHRASADNHSLTLTGSVTVIGLADLLWSVGGNKLEEHANTGQGVFGCDLIFNRKRKDHCGTTSLLLVCSI